MIFIEEQMGQSITPPFLQIFYPQYLRVQLETYVYSIDIFIDCVWTTFLILPHPLRLHKANAEVKQLSSFHHPSSKAQDHSVCAVIVSRILWKLLLINAYPSLLNLQFFKSRVNKLPLYCLSYTYHCVEI